MKCPNCSLDNPDTQRFCGDCGTPIDGNPPAAPGDPDLTETQFVPAIELRTGAVFAGRYQVIEELGAGGMGRVYRVLDRKLDEEVALKLIKYDLAYDRRTLERFRDELKTTRQVVHKNVARLYDLNEAGGIPYITMEYVRGENLRRLIKKVGRLDAAQAVRFATQICRGLAEAHRRDIVHRDLKPHNIMIDEDGSALVMDFGLARLMSSVERTEKGAVEGTPAYVSPEQIEGQAADRRSDLYSLGIVLYEMVTGHPPFKADSPGALAMKHLTELPRNPRETNPDVPAALSRVIMKCLEKSPERRYQSAEQVLTDLDRVEREISTGSIPVPPKDGPEEKTGTPPGIGKHIMRLAIGFVALAAIYGVYRFLIPPGPFDPSIAVLLDREEEAPPELGNLPRGLQKNIVEKLSSIPRLRVIPWEAVAGYDAQGLPDKKIGADLGARHLLRLNFRQVDHDLRLTAKLIDARLGKTTQPFLLDKPMEDYFLLEDQLTEHIAKALRVRLIEERLSKIKEGKPKNLEAYIHFLDGMNLLESDKDSARAIANFERAIEIDPRYALAHWGLGNAYEARYNSAADGGRSEDLERMFQAYRLAYDYDPNSPETNLGLGWAYFNERDNAAAFNHFRKALKIDPGNYTVNKDAGAFLRSLGLYDAAQKYLARAARLNPLDPEPLIQMAQGRAYLGQHGKARDLLKKAVLLAPDNILCLNAYAAQLAVTRRFEEAERAIASAETIDRKGRKLFFVRALLAAARGERQKAWSFSGFSKPPRRRPSRRPSSTCSSG
jgi:eukaryotic-like serine/threonine-protein kinase